MCEVHCFTAECSSDAWRWRRCTAVERMRGGRGVFSPANQSRNPRVMQGCGGLEPVGREGKGIGEERRETAGGTGGGLDGK